MKLPSGWRKLPFQERRAFLAERFESARSFFSFLSGDGEGSQIADAMIENAVGYYPLPLGLVQGLVVDGVEYAVPVATEEASVIAAASFAARVAASCGGFSTSATSPVMTVQIFVADEASGGKGMADFLESMKGELVAVATASLATMAERGGGFRFIEIAPVPASPFVRVELGVDVRDAMGANLLNACGEAAAAVIEERSGVKPLMAIVSNGASLRRARASFALPFDALARAAHGVSGKEAAERIVEACLVACLDRERAITHNKGIMNGITGLAVATGNDFRAVEAASHAWASRGGSYQPLSAYSIEGEILRGELEIPVPFAVVGGGVAVNPGSAFALELLGHPDSRLLGRIAASLGLAQNFAALLALTTEGIQRGHMRLHGRRRELSK
jgi:hydroxymethylglutaryl-CoA reductase